MRRGRDRIQETGQGQDTGDGVPGIGHTRHQGMPQGTRHQGQDTEHTGRESWTGYRSGGTSDRIQDTRHQGQDVRCRGSWTGYRRRATSNRIEETGHHG
jgi:hypothetical protein